MSRMTITGPAEPGFDTILTAQALEFVAALHEEFAPELRALVAGRSGLAGALDRSELGQAVDAVRTAAEAPRPSSVTAPPLGAEAACAADSAAEVWLADLEDGMSPRWDNIITAQLNIASAVRGHNSFIDPRGGRRLHAKTTKPRRLAIRPRAMHASEEHLRWIADDGTESAASAALTDFGLFFFHSAGRLELQGRRPEVVLAKLAGAQDARWWHRVFAFAQEYRGFEDGTISATVQLDSPAAALAIDEIGLALGEHWAGASAAPLEFATALLAAVHDTAAVVAPTWSDADCAEDFLTQLVAHVSAPQAPAAPLSEHSLRTALRLGIDHLERWLRGRPTSRGSETSTAVAELSRTQLWAAFSRRAELADGRSCTPEVFARMLAEELATTLRDSADFYDDAAELFGAAVLADHFEPGLFERAYEAHLIDRRARAALSRRAAA